LNSYLNMKREIAICVLNWNNWRDTVRCLQSLQQCSSPAALIVCDNASDNDSWLQLQHWINTHWSRSDIRLIDQQSPAAPMPGGALAPLTLLRTPHNRGFAAGHNAALHYALADKSIQYCWLLNNDIEIRPDSLVHLLACAEAQPRAALFGSTVLAREQPDIIQCAGGCRYYPWLTHFRAHAAGLPLAKLDTLPAPRLDYIYGAALFLRTEALNRIGLLNEDYFLFYEELDLCRRLEKAGYTFAWCRASLIYHQGSASIGSVAEGDHAKLARANYYENLSTLKYTARFHPAWLPLAAVLRLLLKALAVSARGQWFLLAPLVWAYYDFFRRTRSDRYERRHAAGQG
jgi:GT2 family glycosyltransferase